MKGKVVISGSKTFKDEVIYWKNHFENLGYEVINYPHEQDLDIEEEYTNYYNDIKNCDIFFLMNETKGSIDGYLGASVFAELTYAVMTNKIEGRNIDVLLLNMPSQLLFCYDEMVKWIDLGWIQFFRGKKL